MVYINILNLIFKTSRTFKQKKIEWGVLGWCVKVDEKFKFSLAWNSKENLE